MNSGSWTTLRCGCMSGSHPQGAVLHAGGGCKFTRGGVAEINAFQVLLRARMNRQGAGGASPTGLRIGGLHIGFDAPPRNGSGKGALREQIGCTENHRATSARSSLRSLAVRLLAHARIFAATTVPGVSVTSEGFDFFGLRTSSESGTAAKSQRARTWMENGRNGWTCWHFCLHFTLFQTPDRPQTLCI